MSTNTRLGTTPATHAPNWTEAVCRQVDPDLFFPDRTAGWVKQTEQAKEVCQPCPIRQGCLEWALSTGQRSGVWGGLSEGERRTLLRDRVDRAVSYELCIDAQDYIERRVGEGATHRMIADELGVGHSAVGRAWRFFESERAAQNVQEVQAA
jgi:WhiB family redox-sensing transcriptional regulator